MNINNSDINTNNNDSTNNNNNNNSNRNSLDNNNSNRNSLRNSLNNSINGNGILQNTPTANSINNSGNFSPKEFVSNLDSEDILYENKNVEYKSKSVTIQIKQSTMIIKFNEKNGFTKYLVSDTIVGSTLDNDSVTIYACVMNTIEIQKETRRRKQFILNFENGDEASEFNNQFTESFLDTLPKGNPKERRIRVILNPKSGKKMSESIFNDINQLFKDAKINVKKTVTKGPDHAKQIGYKFNISKYDTIVFISGDGLFHEFVNGLLSRPDYEEAKKIPLALIPAGTGNGIACSLGLQDPISAAFAVIRGYIKPLDVCVIQQGDAKWCSILSLTFGLVSDVDIESEKYRSLGDIRLLIGAAVRIINLRIYKGKVLYLPAFENPLEKSQMQSIPKCSFDCSICDSSSSIETIQNLIYPPVATKTTTTTTTTSTTGSNTNSTPTSPSSSSDHMINSMDKSLDTPSCKIQHENYFYESQDTLMSQGWKCVEGEFIGIVASTVSHLASDFISSPNAHLSDGLIDLIFINNRSKLSKASLLSILMDSATGDHLKSDLIHHHKVKALILEPQPQKNGIIAIDGERIPYGRTSMENIRGCLNLICRSYH